MKLHLLFATLSLIFSPAVNAYTDCPNGYRTSNRVKREFITAGWTGDKIFKCEETNEHKIFKCGALVIRRYQDNLISIRSNTSDWINFYSQNFPHEMIMKIQPDLLQGDHCYSNEPGGVLCDQGKCRRIRDPYLCGNSTFSVIGKDRRWYDSSLNESYSENKFIYLYASEYTTKELLLKKYIQYIGSCKKVEF